MKKLLLLTLFCISVYANGTQRVDEILNELSKQYEVDQKAKAKIEKDRLKIETQTAELQNEKALQDLVIPKSIIVLNNQRMLFVQTKEGNFVKLMEGTKYKNFTIKKITENGFHYVLRDEAAYLPLEVESSKIKSTNQSEY